MFKTINIKVDEDNDFLYYLTVSNSLVGEKDEDGKFIPSPLTAKELELYAEILKINQKFITLEPVFRAEYIHSNSVRKAIRTKLGISSAYYNNIIGRISAKLTIFGNQLYKEGMVAKDFENIQNYEGIQFKFNRTQI
jgi:hypothetical protein